MAEDDIAAQWKSFDDAKRARLLGKMSPEQKKNLRAKLEAQTAPPSPTQANLPAPRLADTMRANLDRNTADPANTGGFFHDKVLNPAIRVANRAGRDVGGMAVDAVDSITRPPLTVEQINAESDNWDRTSLFGSKNESTRPIADTFEGLGNAVPLAPGAGSMVRGYANSEHPVTDMAGDALVAGLAHGISRTTPGSKNAPAPRRISRAVRSVFGAGEEQMVDAATKTAENANTAAEAARAHNKSATEKTLADRGHVDEANATQLRKEAEERKKVNAQRRDALRAHDDKTATVRNENDAAVAEQEKVKALPGKIKTAYRELQAQVETARNNALKIGNEKYNGVNEALNHEQANLGTIQDGVHESLGMIQGTQVNPAIITSIQDQLANHAQMDYSDLQGYYSELGREISKGNLPGDLYQAYNKMHEAIGEDMQRIADANGQGQQLTDARNYWRRMKQTFGKPYNPTDAATATTEKAAPGVASAEEQANRIRMIASFDPTVTQTFDHIQNLQSGLDALPKPAPLRDVVKPLPERPKLPEMPKPGELRQYPEPRGQRPIERPEVSVRGIHEANVEAKMRQWKTLSRYQVGALLGGAVGVITEMLSGRGLGAEASTAVGTAAFALGPMALAKLAENPMVREWITRPQPGQVEALARVPYADRIKITDAMSKVVEQAAKTGNPIPVAPSVAALLGSAQSKGPAPRAKHPSDAWSEDGK